ncbi:MAG: glycosyltransferase family 2 protein [Clostridia bacterium]|nr:glycosyltransferase family 2 protein [Clostridia bacterium]
MSSISLYMIVKNEESTLKRCLSSVKDLVDEIIIIDTGSCDKTKDIAKKFTSKVYDFEWCDDFSKARNYAFSFATCNYIMWLDADDIIPKKTLNELLKLKPALTADTYMLKYNIAFSPSGKPTFSYYRERIVKNCKHVLWQGVVHECIAPFGKIERLNIAINHKKEPSKNSDRNLKIYNSLAKTRALTPREQYYYGRELYDHKQYKKCIRILSGFIDEGLGWRENCIDALYLISDCYKNINNQNQSLFALFKTFYYDTPRANVCCKIADSFFENKSYQTAIYWYSQATRCKDVTENGGFVEPVYYNYYPYLQLCCCYYYLGNINLAKKYNLKARKFYNSPAVQNNIKFFEKL